MRINLLSLVIALLLVACQEKKYSGPQNANSLSEKLDIHLESLISEELTPAISLAVFSPEKILYHRSLGVIDNSTKQPIDSLTAFEAASLSKTVFAYLIMKQVESGIIDLDYPLDSIAVVDIGLQDQQRGIVSPRMVLAHQAGLPNWRGKIDFEATRYQDLFFNEGISFVYTPGKDFHYSGEGYLWLQQVMEKKWGVDLNTYAIQHLFDSLDLLNTSFLFDGRVNDNAANGHLSYLNTTDRLQFRLPVAAGSLHSNALELSRFFQFLLAEAKRSKVIGEMLLPQVTAEEESTYKIQWGLGVGLINIEGKTYLFHWGDNRIFKAYYLYSLEEERGLVFFTNCQEGLRLQPELVELVFGEQVPMWPEDYLK